MSAGIVVCSVCFHEVHQNMQREWYHCADKTPIHQGAQVIFPLSTDRIKGAWCGRDAFTMPGDPLISRQYARKIKHHGRNTKIR